MDQSEVRRKAIRKTTENPAFASGPTELAADARQKMDSSSSQEKTSEPR